MRDQFCSPFSHLTELLNALLNPPRLQFLSLWKWRPLLRLQILLWRLRFRAILRFVQLMISSLLDWTMRQLTVGNSVKYPHLWFLASQKRLL